MEPLWGGEFPVGNGLYKQTMTLCRRYSEYAHWWPHDFFYASKRPSAFWYSILEDSRIPIVVLLKHIISGVARSLARIKIPWREGVLHPYILDGLTAFVDEYSKLAYQTKRVLFARVEQYLEEEYIPGIRASVLDGAIETLSKLLLLGVKNHFKLPETSFLLSALSPQVDVDQINSYSTRMLVACHTFNSDLKRLCEERLAPCYHGAHERDVALTPYNFSLSAWNKLLSMMVFAETTSPATAEACRSWKQVFVTIMSEGDRRRLLPNVMVDTPLRADTK
ncbi:hypothetical protein OF83DRAFT_1105553 [Amylostereum chailletii]|nr:hypothetical protein OF83DRAFT_1105553 [Amylostereum chailletii]